ncbi:POC1 centriolar protein A, partial [Tulasnella sp. 418]
MTSDLVFIVWDTETGTMISTLKENSLNAAGSTISAMHGDIKFPVAFSPDGTQLASAFGTEVILWDYPSLTCTRQLQLNEDRVNCIAFSPDGRYLIGGGDRGQLIIWDITNGLQIDTFRAYLGPGESMAISPDGLQIITCDGSGSPVVSDISSGWGRITDPEGKIDTDTVECVAFSPDGSKLAYGTKDATVVVWDIGRHAVIHTLKGHSKSVATVAFSIDGKYLASGSESGLIVWNVQDEGKVIKPGFIFDPVQKVAFSRDGLYLVAQYQYSISSGLAYCKWSTEDLAQCKTVNITWEQAKHVLKGSPAIVDPLSGTYLAR